MESRSSLSFSYEPATCPYSGSHESNPHAPHSIFKIHFILSSHLRLSLQVVYSLQVFQLKYFMLFIVSMRSTCFAHIIILDLISLIMFRTLSNSITLCNTEKNVIPQFYYEYVSQSCREAKSTLI